MPILFESRAVTIGVGDWGANADTTLQDCDSRLSLWIRVVAACDARTFPLGHKKTADLYGKNRSGLAEHRRTCCTMAGLRRNHRARLHSRGPKRAKKSLGRATRQRNRSPRRREGVHRHTRPSLA